MTTVAHIDNGSHIFSVVRFIINGIYAIAKDGKVLDDRRWTEPQLDEALLACIDASGSSGSTVQVILRRNASLAN